MTWGSHFYVALFVGAGTFIARNEETSWKIFGIILILIGLFFAGYGDAFSEDSE